MKLSALVVSRHVDVRRDLALLVELIDPCVEVVSDVESADEALTQIAALRPELVLIDLNLAGMHALDLIDRIRFQWPESAVVVVGNEPASDYRQLALAAGAVEYVDLLDIGSALPAALKLVTHPGWCGQKDVEADQDPPTAVSMFGLRTRMRASSTGPKYGPFTAWQYVHALSAITLSSVAIKMQLGDDLEPARVAVVLAALACLLAIAARQFRRAQSVATLVRQSQ